MSWLKEGEGVGVQALNKELERGVRFLVVFFVSQ